MVEKYFQEDALSPYKKNYKWKLVVAFVFLAILALIVYTAFFDGYRLTGDVISVNVTDSNLISFDAELTTPSLELDGNFEKVRIGGNLESIYVGSQKFSLLDLSNSYVLIENYDGKIYFNNKNISKLNGKADNVVVNGVPVSSESGKKTKVYFEKASDYDSLEIEETAFINKLSYMASGKITLKNGRNNFEIHDEEVIISKFQGDLKSEKNELKLDGHISKLEILGDTDISVGG
ncbi:hypothetical protein GOV13_04945 [Candidatus Pacearchaeota archaeon]|nr:hypothetical protein [Candidatus Pacearchaeota archaeon]